MLKRAAFLAFSLLICSCTVAQQAPAPPPEQRSDPFPQPQADDASIWQGIYTNYFFGFSYGLPAGFTASPDAPGSPHRPGPQIYQLFEASAPTFFSERRIIIEVDPWADFTDVKTADFFLQRFTRNYAPVYEVVTPPAERTYAGKRFFTLGVRTPGYYAVTNLVAWRSYALAFVFTAEKEADVATVAASLNTLNFFGPKTALHGGLGFPGKWQGEPRFRRPTQGRTDCERGDAALARGVSPEFAESRLISRVLPVYPELARQLHIQGTVTLAANIGCDGAVESLWVPRGHGMLRQAAVDAAKQWRYQPYPEGEPERLTTTIKVVFALDTQFPRVP